MHIFMPVIIEFSSGYRISRADKAESRQMFWGGKAKDIAPEIIHGIEEVLAVVTACTGEIHRHRVSF